MEAKTCSRRGDSSESSQGVDRRHGLISTPACWSSAMSGKKVPNRPGSSSENIDLGDIESRHFDAIIKRFDSDRPSWELIETGKDVLDRAERLGRENKLRALDAIHAASVILFREATGLNVSFVTADSAQRDAAAILSVDVVWVG